MHMSDALVSPAVGGALWAAAAGTCAVAARRVERHGDERLVPLMGVLGAFVFACQMVNFAIPGTGSSGHLGGGLLLAILLGPDAAFLALTSVLLVQALFFADGGLLALGCNVVNLGLFTTYLAYPLVFRPIAGPAPSRRRLVAASLAAGVVGLQLGAFAVVLETWASGVSSLPFRSFAMLMLPIHLAIGVVEGAATAAIVLVVRRARPELAAGAPETSSRSLRPVVLGIALVAAFTGGVGSWFASSRPDGLEWATARAAQGEAAAQDGLHEVLARAQRAVALLPDYDFSANAAAGEDGVGAPRPAWPAPRTGTSVSGLLGAALTLSVVALAIGGLRLLRRRTRASR
jgi:cobalt/nickel transport system permease protein